MAANWYSKGVARLGKRYVNQIRSDPTLSPSFSLRRGVHASVYDKNPDDQLRPVVVPDELIQSKSDKYWAPHPQTGVFGPATEHYPIVAGGECGFRSSPANTTGDSVLEQKAFFRALEDLEKPPHP